jgi:hypothetical protein
MQEEKDNVEKENYTDPRNVQAEVIGELRKEKIGRPMIVIELAILFIIVLIGLPIVNSMMQDENSVLYKFLNGSNTSSNITTKQAYLDGSKEQSLLSTTVMKSGNIILKNFLLYNNTVKMTISSFNNVINLDEEEYYFEILSSKNNSKLAAIKLTGTYDYQEKTVEFKTLTNFNSNITYVGKIVLLKDEDYPDYKLQTDESGIGGITCKKDSREIEYIFYNDKLMSINDTQVITKNGLTDEEYLNKKSVYDKLVINMGKLATLEETSDGLLYKANIDLEKSTVPKNVVEYNYYVKDTNVKKVHYAMTGKGFDCK